MCPTKIHPPLDKNEKRIPNPQSVLVRLSVGGTTTDMLSQCPTPPTPDNLLARVFSVSQAELVRSEGEELSVEVLRAPGAKCARCWLVLPDVGTHPDYPDLCTRCVEVLRE